MNPNQEMITEYFNLIAQHGTTRTLNKSLSN